MQTETVLSPELQRVLWAFYECWKATDAPNMERQVCFESMIGPFINRFKVKFEPVRLKELAKLGLLARADPSRRRIKRFYSIPEPERVAQILMHSNIR